MKCWASIQYRDFWDVPRIFVVTHGSNTFLFDCPFDEATEDYPDSFRVYLVPCFTPEDLAGSWDKLHERAVQFLGEVKIAEVPFDATLRKQVETTLLDRLAASESVVIRSR